MLTSLFLTEQSKKILDVYFLIRSVQLDTTHFTIGQQYKISLCKNNKVLFLTITVLNDILVNHMS